MPRYFKLKIWAEEKIEHLSKQAKEHSKKALNKEIKRLSKNHIDAGQELHNREMYAAMKVKLKKGKTDLF